MTVCIWMMEKNSNILDLRILKRKNFFKELLIAINLLKNKLNDEYIIDDNMDFLKKKMILKDSKKRRKNNKNML